MGERAAHWLTIISSLMCGKARRGEREELIGPNLAFAFGCPVERVFAVSGPASDQQNHLALVWGQSDRLDDLYALFSGLPLRGLPLCAFVSNVVSPSLARFSSCRIDASSLAVDADFPK
ncbi:hypothetical protein ACEN2Q_01615 [Bremerella cremea]|uniref:hypothetical protein n=1 Tax=Bremerella cremea TaxID=1031537 RepID=UPI003570F538